jgi:hypothetical protein
MLEESHHHPRVLSTLVTSCADTKPHFESSHEFSEGLTFHWFVPVQIHRSFKYENPSVPAGKQRFLFVPVVFPESPM